MKFEPACEEFELRGIVKGEREFFDNQLNGCRNGVGLLLISHNPWNILYPLL